MILLFTVMKPKLAEVLVPVMGREKKKKSQSIEQEVIGGITFGD